MIFNSLRILIFFLLVISFECLPTQYACQYTNDNEYNGYCYVVFEDSLKKSRNDWKAFCVDGLTNWISSYDYGNNGFQLSINDDAEETWLTQNLLSVTTGRSVWTGLTGVGGIPDHWDDPWSTPYNDSEANYPDSITNGGATDGWVLEYVSPTHVDWVPQIPTSKYRFTLCKYKIPLCNDTLASNSNVCSGNGWCLSDENCYCTVPKWMGTYCHEWSCNDISHANESVCSGHGTCSNIDSCECDDQYSGTWCSIADQCNSKNFFDLSVCSGRGTCISQDNCTCNERYTGEFCEIAEQCFGIDFDDDRVCSNLGNCTAMNVCECNEGVQGNNCQIGMQCFGINATDDQVCSNNGTCEGIDYCNCNLGYEGNECETWRCNNILYTNSSVCNDRGFCLSPNNCVCDTNYEGVDCENWRCFSLLNNDLASCSSPNGTCSSPDYCECEIGYYGLECQYWNCSQFLFSDFEACSGENGTCIAPNTCECINGHEGSICETWRCNGVLESNQVVCSGNGTCVSYDTCDCFVGYEGTDCEDWRCHGILHNDISVCSNNGTCLSPDTCICSSGYFGEQCQNWNCSGMLNSNPFSCSGNNGTCISPNNCLCNNDHEGSICETWRCNGLLESNGNVCSGNGSCISPEVCECSVGYEGNNCEDWKCNGVLHNDILACSSNGTCLSPDICWCSFGYFGNDCQYWNCSGIINTDSNSCSGINGTCIGPDNCLCNGGNEGNTCETWRCNSILESDPFVCSGNGSCISHDNCICDGGYDGSACESWFCGSYLNTDGSSCSGDNGTCIGVDNCMCNSGYFGNTCEFYECYNVQYDNTSACNVGTCVEPNICDCPNGYSGNECEIFYCFALLHNDTENNVCSYPNGSCSYPNFCSCESGYYGERCETFNCFDIPFNDSISCSGMNGTCVAPNSCNCNEDYEGSECEIWNCFGILNNDEAVCSYNGFCISPDNCICTGEGDGHNCGGFKCFGISQNETDVVCSNGNGTCVGPNTCMCGDYVGEQCEAWNCFSVLMNDSSSCSGENGTCIAPNTCDCNVDYEGSECENWRCYGILNDDISVCSYNGFCVSPDNCICTGEGDGHNCGGFKCFGISQNETDLVCSNGNGTCIGPNNCMCDDYIGEQCEAWSCFGILMNDSSSCSGENGTCIAPNICSCNNGYIGEECEHWTCFGELSNETFACSFPNGSCIAPNTCSCNEGYHENECHKWKCSGEYFDDANSCSGTNGTCISPDNCLCIDGFEGSECEDWRCFGFLKDDISVCSFQNGSCIDINTCICNEEYYGNECDMFECFGYEKNDTLSCNYPNGTCGLPDTCFCESGYIGLGCDHWECFGELHNSSTVCSYPNGTCLAPDLCNCATNFENEDCSMWRCFDVKKNDSSVCSGRGSCLGHNVCQCISHEFVGQNCEDCAIGYVGVDCDTYYDPPNMELQYSELIGTCSPLYFDARLSSGFGTSFHWTSSNEDIIFPNNFPLQEIETTFIGEVNITLEIIDHWSRSSGIQTFIVNRVNSSFPLATIDGPSLVISFANNDDFYLYGDFSTSCGGSNEEYFTYKWTQLSPTFPVVSFGPDVNATISQRRLNFPHGFPVFNVQNSSSISYEFQFEIDSPMGSSRSNVFVDVIMRDLVALLNVSNKDNLPVGSVMYISGMSSYDPEESPSIEAYEFICTYNGTMECPFENIDNTIKVELSYESTYEISMTYAKSDGRSSSKSVIFTTIQYDNDVYVPNIWIESIPLPLSSSKQIRVYGGIEEDEDGKSLEVTFTWDCPSVFDFNSNHTITGINSLTLVLKENALLENTICYFYGTHENITVSSSISIIIPTPPLYGTYDVFPRSGYVLEEFEIVIDNWITSYPPLSYELEFIHCITGRTKLVQSVTLSNSFKFYISSQGCQQFNYSVDMNLRVIDSYGGFTQERFNVHVLPVQYDTVYGKLEYINSILNESLIELTDNIDIDVMKVKQTLEDVLEVNNILNPNCSSLTLQEQLCMSLSECEEVDLVNMPQSQELFQHFLYLSMAYLHECIIHDTLDISDIQKVIEIFDMFVHFKLDHNDILKIESVVSFFNSFILSYGSALSIGKFQMVYDVLEISYGNINSIIVHNLYNNDITLKIHTFLHNLYVLFINKMNVNAMNIYLTSKLNIFQFVYTKDYASNYKENRKLRIREKDVTLNIREGLFINKDELFISIPGEIVLGYSFFDIISCYVYTIDTAVDLSIQPNDQAYSLIRITCFNEDQNNNMLIGPSHGNEITNGGHLKIKFFHNTSAVTCVQYNQIENNYEKCDFTYYNNDDESITCWCNRINTYYTLLYINDSLIDDGNGGVGDSGNDFDPNLMYILGGIGLLGLFGLIIIIVIIIIIVLILFYTLQKKKEKKKKFDVPISPLQSSQRNLSKRRRFLRRKKRYDSITKVQKFSLNSLSIPDEDDEKKEKKKKKRISLKKSAKRKKKKKSKQKVITRNNFVESIESSNNNPFDFEEDEEDGRSLIDKLRNRLGKGGGRKRENSRGLDMRNRYMKKMKLRKKRAATLVNTSLTKSITDSMEFSPRRRRTNSMSMAYLHGKRK